MESKWLLYLKRHVPGLYADAMSDMQWEARWRDEKIIQLEDELSSLKPKPKPTSVALNDGVGIATAIDMLKVAHERHNMSSIPVGIAVGESVREREPSFDSEAYDGRYTEK